ncbi:MAG: translation elongation factor Ts [bacterium]|jgi:elongation factor Ts
MADITAAMVQELREATNVGMMECKRALVEAGGDKDQAIRLLRERGMAIAAKKSTRTANQGLIASAGDSKTSILIEINCETDFVTKNENFQKFVKSMATKALSIPDGKITEVTKVEMAAKIAEIGENLVAKRNIGYTLQGSGMVASYIHLNGKLGVLVELGCGKEATSSSPVVQELAKDLTLHIAACSPRYLVSQDVPEDIVAAEREIYAKQVVGKPANIVDKIVDGKIAKFYSQVCLVDQGFVKDPDTSITKLLEAKGKEVGDTLTIRRFVRWQLGE